MMRHTTTLSGLLAAALVLPAIGMDTQRLRALERTLDETQQALRVLNDLKRRITVEPRGVAPVVLSVTEEPLLNGAKRDDRLMLLRNEVDLLQMELDAMNGGGDAQLPPALIPPPQAGVGPTAMGAPGAHTGGLSNVTTGLDPARLALLGDVTDGMREMPASRPTAARMTPSGMDEDTASTYSADPVGQARTCFLAGQFERGLRLLAGRNQDARALYWKGRCLEKLERLDEAIKALEQVVEIGGEGFEFRRAKTDLDFLIWKRGFLKRLPAKDGGLK